MATFVKLDQEVVKTRLPTIFQERLPQATQISNFLQFYLSGIPSRLEIPTEFYWYNALELDQACIVAKLTRKEFKDTIWMILAPKSGAKEAMQEFCKIVSFNTPTSFNFVEDDIVSNLQDLCKQNGMPARFCAPGYLYTMSMESALEFDISEELSSEEVEIKPLTVEDVPTLVKHWKLGPSNAFEEVKASLGNLPSAGLFVNGTLVSGAYTAIDSGIHAVFTVSEYRGKGYAQLVVKYICKTLAEAGLIPGVQIESFNSTSISMMKKIGFKFAQNITWLGL